MRSNHIDVVIEAVQCGVEEGMVEGIEKVQVIVPKAVGWNVATKIEESAHLVLFACFPQGGCSYQSRYCMREEGPE